MNYFENPKEICINGNYYKIRTDYRDILTILEAFEDKELLQTEKLEVLISILYKDTPPNCEETFIKAYQFLDVNIEEFFYNRNKKVNKKKNNKSEERYYSFVKDWQLIVGALNNYFGFSIREAEYIHWWDFIAAFNNIGESTFSHVIDLRKRKKENKLTDDEKKYYYKNREWLDLDYEEIDYNKLFDDLNKNLGRR